VGDLGINKNITA
jgi:hypothetical protein